MQSRERWRWLAFVALSLVAVLAVARGRRARQMRAAGQFAERAVTSAGRVEGCLVGARPLTTDARALASRLRAMALGTGDPAWPRSCLDALGELSNGPPRAAAPEPEARAVCDSAGALKAALERADENTALAAFRAGSAEGRPPGWATELGVFHRSVAALARRHGLSAQQPAVPAVARVPLAGVSADVVPVPLTPGSFLTGWNFSAGILAMTFVEPSLDRVFCRSRDRGLTLGCTRMPVTPAGTPVALVGHDRAEALLLVTRPGVGVIEPVDAPGTTVFPLGAPPSRTLAARVAGDVLYAMVDTPAGAALERVARGGAREAREPAGVPASAEAVLVTPEGAPAWWFAAAAEHDAPVLVARPLPADLSAPAGEAGRVAALHSPAALLYGCQSGAVGYVAAVDAPGGLMVAVDGTHAPRVLGTLEQADLPAEMVCDATGATLVGATTVQSCERGGGCSARWTAPGVRRFARAGGTVVQVLAAVGGGLRVRRGTPAEIDRAEALPVADDSLHGGVDAQSVWLFPADDRLVLLAVGDVNVVLSSGDGGLSWRPAGEGTEPTGHPR